MNEVIAYILSALFSGGLIMTFITHFLTKKKYLQDVKLAEEAVKLAQADVHGKEIDNVEKAAQIWRELSEKMKATFDTQITTLESKVSELTSKLAELSNQLAETKRELEDTKKALRASDHKNATLSEQLRIFNKNYLSHETSSKG